MTKHRNSGKLSSRSAGQLLSGCLRILNGQWGHSQRNEQREEQRMRKTHYVAIMLTAIMAVSAVPVEVEAQQQGGTRTTRMTDAEGNRLDASGSGRLATVRYEGADGTDATTSGYGSAVSMDGMQLPSSMRDRDQDERLKYLEERTAAWEDAQKRREVHAEADVLDASRSFSNRSRRNANTTIFANDVRDVDIEGQITSSSLETLICAGMVNCGGNDGASAGGAGPVGYEVVGTKRFLTPEEMQITADNEYRRLQAFIAAGEMSHEQFVLGLQSAQARQKVIDSATQATVRNPVFPPQGNQGIDLDTTVVGPSVR